MWEAIKDKTRQEKEVEKAEASEDDRWRRRGDEVVVHGNPRAAGEALHAFPSLGSHGSHKRWNSGSLMRGKPDRTPLNCSFLSSFMRHSEPPEWSKAPESQANGWLGRASHLLICTVSHSV